MTKNTQKSSYFVKKSHLFAKIAVICAIFLLILLLCGCAKTPTETATDNANQAVNTLEQSLPKECKTAGINEQIKTIHASIEQINTDCGLELRAVRAERNGLVVALVALIGVLAFLISKKFKIL